MEERTEDQILEQLETDLEQKHYAAIKDTLNELPAADVAALFEEMPEENIPLLFRLLSKELAADVFVDMEPEAQELLIHGFSDTELKEVVDELYVDDAVDIIEEMPANVVKRILQSADSQTRQQINNILQYPEDSAGSIMTTEYVDLKKSMTVADAIKRIRRTGVDKETIYTCYVTDESRKLLGMVSVKTLLLAEEDDVIEDIMETHVISVNTLDDQEEVANQLTKYDFMAIPVVDREERLVGIVTFDDAMDIIEEETTEDIEKMAAITPSDRPYLKTGVWRIFAQRIPWLLVLMVSATFTGMIIASFEDSLAKFAVLTAFIPMLMDTGGNSGSQASVTVIRGLSLHEIEMGDILRVVWKESRIGLLVGAVLAAVNFGKIMLVDRLLLGNTSISVTVAAVVCLTLVATVFLAKLVGCSLPIAAKRLGFDPAVMASPFITTIVDALSLFIYLKIATAFLPI
ncbi:MAG: magnesium transporter [Acutalibacteraceae bacterium]|jgi:magnesium transporter